MFRSAILATACALTLAACQSGDIQKFISNVGSVIPSVTASVSNPVTPARFYKAENAVTVAVAGLNGYRKQCIAGTINVNCYDTVAGIQVYTKKMQTTLPELRRFVRANDQVNAIQTFNELMTLYDNAKAAAPVGVIPTNPAN